METPILEPKDGEFRVRNSFVSVDPYMRGRMNDVKSYAPPVQIGEVMGGGAIGTVIASQNPQFADGDFVEGLFGWQEFAVSNGKGVRKLDMQGNGPVGRWAETGWVGEEAEKRVSP